jgi:hypothetical protein
VIAEGDDEPPAGERHARGLERDALAERRARRAGPGEPAELRRGDATQDAMHTLERQLADLRRRQMDAERERERLSEQLAGREHELRRVKQREYAEQQLRVEAEENVSRLRRRQRAEIDRLQRHVEEARLAMQGTGERAEELRVRAEQDRDEAERRRKETERRLAAAERERLQAEQRCATLAAHLATVSDSCARLQAGMLVLEGAAGALRAEVEDERATAGAQIRELERERTAAADRVWELERECAAADVRVRQLERALGPVTAPRSAVVSPEARRDEMAGALAAAVERLRARVATVEEPDPDEPDPDEPEAPTSETPAGGPVAEASVAETPATETPATEVPPAQAPPAETPVAEPAAIEVVPRQLQPPTRREPWLAAAIRAIAERRDPKLAAELVCELLPAQRLVVERSLSYGLRIAELESRWQVRLAPGRAEVGAAAEAGSDFELRGRAADFAELAAGGTGRRLPEIEIEGSRRRARSLRRARRRPLALWDLASAGIDVWPGLLLLALAEAIEPRWSAGLRFTIAFEIEESPRASTSVTLHVQVRDGAPLAVTSKAHERPVTTVRLGERAFMCMFAGAPLPAGERVLVEGEMRPLERLIEWSDRAQGRSAATASLRRSRA